MNSLQPYDGNKRIVSQQKETEREKVYVYIYKNLKYAQGFLLAICLFLLFSIYNYFENIYLEKQLLEVEKESESSDVLELDQYIESVIEQAEDEKFESKDKKGNYESPWKSFTEEERAKYTKAFIKKVAPLAVNEAKLTKIPASVTIAQACIESECGFSTLAVKAKNHFGIKCFNKNCPKGHCMRFTDDSYYDRFKKYSSLEASIHDHSRFLQYDREGNRNKRYRFLWGYDKNFKKWCHGLERAGYATDKNYGEKLEAFIIKNGLQKYDALY